MPMLDFLFQLDTFLFYVINKDLANPLFDWLMPFVTKKEHGFPLWIAVYIMLLWKGGKKGRIAALLIIPVIFASDQLSAQVLKPLFERIRPCVALENVRLLTGMKTSYSFPSAHATNIFAAATFFTLFYPKGKWAYLTLALLVSISRVYVGVHYPSDVIAGAIVGWIIGWIVFQILKQLILRFPRFGRKMKMNIMASS